MKNFILAAVLFLYGPVLYANDTKSSTTKANGVHYFAGLGLGSVFEQNSLDEPSYLSYSNYFAGISFNSWSFSLDRSQARSESGNATLSIKNRVYINTLMGDYESTFYQKVFAFAGLGLGFWNQEADTTLYQNTTTDKSKDGAVLVASGGLRFRAPWIMVSTEIRIMSIEGWDPSPTVSPLLRFAVWY